MRTVNNRTEGRPFKSQIREQKCLEKHFQYEFSILGRFGQPGAAEGKKVQTAISMQLLRPVFFYVFMNRDEEGFEFPYNRYLGSPSHLYNRALGRPLPSLLIDF